MSPLIDLSELRRESETVEWKENVADIDDVVATLCAFANDLSNLGGGYVVCGAREDKDEYGFPQVVSTGLTAQRIAEDYIAQRAGKGWRPVPPPAFSCC